MFDMTRKPVFSCFKTNCFKTVLKHCFKTVLKQGQISVVLKQ